MSSVSVFGVLGLVFSLACTITGCVLLWINLSDILTVSDMRSMRYVVSLFVISWLTSAIAFASRHRAMLAINLALLFTLTVDAFTLQEMDNIRTLLMNDTFRSQLNMDLHTLQKCAAGGVLAYFGVGVAFLIATMGQEEMTNLSHENAARTLAAISSLLVFVGCIVDWTSDCLEVKSVFDLSDDYNPVRAWAFEFTEVSVVVAFGLAVGVLRRNATLIIASATLAASRGMLLLSHVFQLLAFINSKLLDKNTDQIQAAGFLIYGGMLVSLFAALACFRTESQESLRYASMA